VLNFRSGFYRIPVDTLSDIEQSELNSLLFMRYYAFSMRILYDARNSARVIIIHSEE